VEQPATSRILSFRRHGLAAEGLQRLYADTAWLQQLLIEELRPRQRRIRNSVRMAFICAAGSTLMAALHVDSVLGPATLWVALYASSSRMTASEGLLLVLTYAAMLSASVPIAGILVDAPWMLVPFFGLATALMTYGLSKRGLAGAWLNVQVTFLDTFYLCVFDPKEFGWSVAYTFAGVALAIGVLVAFDMVLWPDPAEAALLRSLSLTLDQERDRLAMIGRAYLDPLAVAILPRPSVLSLLPRWLPLMERARRELDDTRRAAVLLAAVTRTERLHIEVERLLAIAREDVARGIRARLRPEIEAALQAIDAALRQLAHEAATGLGPPQDSTYTGLSTAIASSLDALRARETLAVSRLRSGDAAATANLAAYTSGLRKIGLRLLNRPLGDVYELAFPQDARRAATPSGGADPALRRYSAKVGLATAVAYVVALTSHRAELSVIVWTVILAGLQTYGATLRKMILRIAGGVLGGLLALPVMMVVSPNFESVGSYLVAFFLVLFMCAYVSLSSGRLAYAGQQAGVSFILAYASLSPNANFYQPLWRVWGIFLGLVIVTLVFLLVAPEYAGDALVPRLTRILRAALELLPPVAGLNEQRVQEIDMEATLNLTQLLGIAEDARLEGRHSKIHPEGVIEAAGTLGRIVHRLSAIASGRLALPQLDLPTEIQTARTACEAALRIHLESWLGLLEGVHGVDRRRAVEVAEHFTVDDLEGPLAKLRERVFAPDLETLASWPAAARNTLLVEIESYHRLAVLVTELDRQFVAIPATKS
jgi:Fusaric acid resistance protein family